MPLKFTVLLQKGFSNNLVTVNPDLGLTIDDLHPTWEGYKVIGALLG